MHIEKKEFEEEKAKLKDTNDWLKSRIDNMEIDYKTQKAKVSELKKQARGSYSYELEAAQRLYEMTTKNLKNYKEVKGQPYFARIDFREYRRDTENFYIGKIGLSDETSGDEIVIDWRAPIADLYYSGTQGKSTYHAPAGIIEGELSLKRKFMIRGSKLEDAFDEGINQIILRGAAEEIEGTALDDEFLKINLEQGVSSKLKDIVATIQKEQNEIIRAEKNKALIVQGSAGSGKTTIALHRLAYLIYKYQERLTGQDILVVAPNALFLDYISEVLPNLGVDKVPQKTFEGLALDILGIKSEVLTKDKKLAHIIENIEDSDVKYKTNSSKVKGSLVFRTILDRYAKYIEINGLNYEDIEVDGYRLFRATEIKTLFSKNLVHLPISKRKDEMKRYFNGKLKSKLAQISEEIDSDYEFQMKKIRATVTDAEEKRNILTKMYDERDKKKEALNINAKQVLKNYFSNWDYDDVRKLYLELFNNEELFDMLSSNKIPEALAEYMREELNKNFENSIIDSDDLAPMMYLKYKIEGIDEKHKYKHIVIDEAQDYSMLELYMLRNVVINDSFTIVGDVGQSIYFYKGINDWQKLIEEVYNEYGEYVALTQSYRSTVEIVSFANRVLKKQSNSLKPAKPVLRHGMEPELIKYTGAAEFRKKVDEIVKEVEKAGKKNTAIICKTYSQCKQVEKILSEGSEYKWEVVNDTDKKLNLKNIIIPSYMTKGLEFDCSVIYNCDDENYRDDELDKKLLYVALTRALHMEYVFYKDEPSKLISG